MAHETTLTACVEHHHTTAPGPHRPVQDGGDSSRFPACVEHRHTTTPGPHRPVQDGGDSSRFAACVENGYF
jgi:hypothetical protein